MLSQPSFERPALIAGFSGWPNAGEVSTAVVSFLIKHFGTNPFASIRPEEFYDLSEQRPVVSVKRGLIQSIVFPKNEFYSACIPGPEPLDLVLFLGHEPHLRWSKFTEAILDVAQNLGVEQIYTVGGVYDQIPHTAKPRVSVLTNNADRLELLQSKGIHLSDYEGPASLHTLLLESAAQRQITVSALWGHVPYYIQSNNAKTCLALLEALQRLLERKFELDDIREASRQLDEQIERIVRSKPELREHIHNLEQSLMIADGLTDDNLRKIDPKPSGEKIIHIDSFLHKKDDPL